MISSKSKGKKASSKDSSSNSTTTTTPNKENKVINFNCHFIKKWKGIEFQPFLFQEQPNWKNLFISFHNLSFFFYQKKKETPVKESSSSSESDSSDGEDNNFKVSHISRQ